MLFNTLENVKKCENNSKDKINKKQLAETGMILMLTLNLEI